MPEVSPPTTPINPQPSPAPKPVSPPPITPPPPVGGLRPVGLPQRPFSPPPPSKKPTEIKHPPLVYDKTQGLLAEIEKKLGGRVVSYYIHPGGGMVQDDVKYFYSHLKNIGRQEKLYFILVSSGGDGQSAWRIASLLNSFCNELIIVLPEMAASAATILSLAADELIMTPLAYLTAVDTSLYHPLNPRDNKNNSVPVGLDEVKRAIKMLTENVKEETSLHEIYKTIFSYIHPVALGAVERSTNLSEMLCRNIIELRKKNKVAPELVTEIIRRLNSSYPSHTYPIPRHKARELGLTVTDSDKELDNLLWQLANTYRFMAEPARTDYSETYYRSEVTPKFIESLGSRIFLSNVIEKRLDSIIKGWFILRDEFRWISAFEKEENGKKEFKLSYLDF